ncbi:MAG: hypothetical protein QNL14_18925, partial [Deltaproteobacteria bacterium]|nr:hypothetical protein [Deltaproteobacteria bacterium]
MRTSALKTTAAYFLITFSILILATLRAGAAESGTTDNIVQNPATVAKGDGLTPSESEKSFLFKESAFREFFKHGKEKLKLFGSKLTAVFTNYPKIPSEIIKALNHLTGGKGPGHLVEVFLLFLLMLAIGFGVEKIFNIPMKKYKQQLQGSIPKSFIQLTGRLSARTVIELLSFGVFAVTIVVVYLLFYPTRGPLYELAMVYLPPIFFMRLAFILLNALYSPTMPHMRISPQNCRSSAMYLMGFMAFIIVSFFVTKTLWLLKTHGMSQGVFLLLYSHLGLFQFLILLAMLWKDRARITRSIGKEQDFDGSPASSSGSGLKRVWFPLACVGLL